MLQKILPLLFLTAMLCAAAGPEVYFNEREHDFGEIERGQKVTYEFVFVNKGDEKLQIGEVEASCGCTTAEPEKKEYAPKEEGRLTVQFDSKEFEGDVIKTITVNTNDPKHPKTMLNIRVKVVNDVIIEPQSITFEKATFGGESKSEFTVRSERMEKLEILNLEAGPEWLTVSTTQVNPKTVKFSLIANGKKFPKGQNRLRGFVNFETNSKNRKDLTVNVVANVVLPVSTVPNFVLLWGTKKGQTRTMEIKLSSPDQKPFKVIDTFFEQPFLSAKLSVDEPANKVLVVTLADNVEQGQFQDTLRIITDLPDYTEIPLRVRGSVVP